MAMSNPLIDHSLHSTFEGSGMAPGMEEAEMGVDFSHVKDYTPHQVAAILVLSGGVLYFLKQFGFRFNFGVAAGR